jgi:hypothetical protein
VAPRFLEGSRGWRRRLPGRGRERPGRGRRDLGIVAGRRSRHQATSRIGGLAGGLRPARRLGACSAARKEPRSRSHPAPGSQQPAVIVDGVLRTGGDGCFFLNGKMGLEGPGSCFIDHLGTLQTDPYREGVYN